MKYLHAIGAVVMVILLMLAGCGSATEVGNPTGEIPILRTVKGIIDEVSLNDAFATTMAVATIEESIDLAGLSVVATPIDPVDADTITTAVNLNGIFDIELEVNITYAMEVRQGEVVIGNFSFEQDIEGGRANRFRLNAAGSPVDLGTVRYQGGIFYPDNEPRHQAGVQMGPGNGAGGPP